MRLVRIRDAKPLDNYRVQLTLTDGRLIERDRRPMLVGPVFDEIRNDEAKFREMCVEGGTVVWPGSADLCPDVLIWGRLTAGRCSFGCGGTCMSRFTRCPLKTKLSSVTVSPPGTCMSPVALHPATM
jgi:hypothetical protein